MRARDLGVLIGTGRPGTSNAITDVAGVRVGHVTIIDGEGPLRAGQGPVRTGVTVIVPCEEIGRAQVFAGCHRLNGNGEMTGLEWVRESGMLTSPIALTNTHSVGVVRDALVEAAVKSHASHEVFWSLPVAAETWDGALNDINGFHVRREHVFRALESASSGAVKEGNVGGGTGMICHEFKGGIGTSSRVVPEAVGAYTVGVLVQANYGRRERLTVAGVPVGREISVSEVPSPLRAPHLGAGEAGPDGRPGAGAGAGPGPGAGSILVVVATDAPLLPHQCSRMAQRAGLGLARAGGVGENSSGDLFIAFATGNAANVAPHGPESEAGPPTYGVTMLADPLMTALYDAVVEATEEAIVNALVAAETMTGIDGVTAHRLPHDRLMEVMGAYGRS